MMNIVHVQSDAKAGNRSIIAKTALIAVVAAPIVALITHYAISPRDMLSISRIEITAMHPIATPTSGGDTRRIVDSAAHQDAEDRIDRKLRIEAGQPL
jgi:hypothetical protein